MKADKIIQLIDIKIQKAINAIHTTSLGRIVSYDPINMRANVELLENIHFKGKFYKSPILIGCLVAYDECGSFYNRIPYSKGDKVLVGYCESSIDYIILDGDNKNQIISRRHSEDDAVVLRGWKTENSDELLSDNINDVVWVNKNTGAKIAFKLDGEVEIDNGVNIKISPNGVVTTTATTINATSATINCDTLNASSSLTIASKELKEHVHGSGTNILGQTDPQI